MCSECVLDVFWMMLDFSDWFRKHSVYCRHSPDAFCSVPQVAIAIACASANAERLSGCIYLMNGVLSRPVIPVMLCF